VSGELQGKTLFISGGSRGIGLAIAARAAGDGANVCLIAKTSGGTTSASTTPRRSASRARSSCR